MYILPAKHIDGFGSQFQYFISAIIYAELNGFEYVHRPVTVMDHNYNNDPTFLQRMNDAMNIDSKYRRYDELKETDKEHKTNGKFKDFFDRNFEQYYNSASLQNIKRKYLENKPPKHTIFEKDVVHITVHVRRFNSHDSRGVDNIDNLLLFKMRQMNKEYQEKNIRHHFHIESQGTIENFSHFEKAFDNISFHLNDEPDKSFYRMVISDVLITHKSSFSYAAALLSDGIIYFKKFWHIGAEKWHHF